jgi:hypothetical protein
MITREKWAIGAWFKLLFLLSERLLEKVVEWEVTTLRTCAPTDACTYVKH